MAHEYEGSMVNEFDANQAEYQAAWANEIVYMCEKHMQQLASIGRAMGCPISPIPYDGVEFCKNCQNEK